MNNIEVKRDGIYLEEKRISLISGTVHYWRLEKILWSEILDKVKELGFKVIETYIPWSIHEIERGKFDFGQIDERKDLDGFLSLCQEKDLYITVRPGPHINAELTYFGYPKRVLQDREIFSRSPEGNPVWLPSPPKAFPIPSYACEKFYQEVGSYFDALCPILTKHLYPKGKIIAIQSDNECSMFFRLQPFDHDYSTSSIYLYRKFLSEKYNGIKELNEAYRTDYRFFAEVEPPRDFLAEKKEDLPYYMDWVEYKQYYHIYGVSRIANMLKRRGINIPYYHNYPAFFIRAPFNIVEMEKHIDFQGYDIYVTKKNYDGIKIGTEIVKGTSRLPYSPEFGSGGAWFFARTTEDDFFLTKAAFMNGLKAINFYMIVERERWYGSPITRHGKFRKEKSTFYQKLLKILEEIDYSALEEEKEIALLFNRDYDLLELTTSMMTPLPVNMAMFPAELYCYEDNFGFKDIIQIENQRLWRGFYYGLKGNHFPFALADTDLPVSEWKKYKVVIVPVFEFLNEGIEKKLIEYVQSGGILVMGPRCPEFNQKMKEYSIFKEYLAEPIEFLEKANLEDLELSNIQFFAQDGLIKLKEKTIAYVKEIGQGKVVHFGFNFLPPEKNKISTGLLRMIETIMKIADIQKEIDSNLPEIQLSLLKSESKEILFIANPNREEKETTISFRDGRSANLIDLWEGVESRVDGEFKLLMKPYDIKIFEVKNV